MSDVAVTPQSSPSRTLGWAIYLGVSWTWCIGMYLPVLLLRDMGVAAFWVFAIPNIVGAAAFAWFIRDAEHSRRFISKHASACVWFSLITILFHAFFAAWIIEQITGPTTGIWIAVIFWIIWLILPQRRAGPFLTATITLAISLVALVWGLTHPGLLPKIAYSAAPVSALNALWLAPVCILGFGLCPYLDLTFHHARQAMPPAAGRTAFALGFAVVFAAMLGFTVCYSGWLAHGFNRHLYPAIALLLGAHLIVQTCFTVAAHARLLSPDSHKITVLRFFGFALLFVAVVLIGIFSHTHHLIYRGLSPGELAYRCFMVFYGLVFPAYVLIRIFPSRAASRRLIFALVVAAPMYWMGFIERQPLWLIPGPLIILAVAFAGKKNAGPTPSGVL